MTFIDTKKVTTALLGGGIALISWGGQQFMSQNYVPGGIALILGLVMVFGSELYKELQAKEGMLYA